MWTGQQAGLLFFEPRRRLFAMTFGAVPVAAGMIGITNLSAVVALCHVAAEKRGATKFDVTHRPELSREQGVISSINRSVLAENIRHFNHGQMS
jgi:hypothetical protein